MANYQVLFNGEITAGADEAQVRANLADALGLNEQKIKQLFSGRTVVIRSQLSESDAQAWASRLSQLGAVCRIKDLSARKPSDDFLADKHNREAHERTLRDITAAHIECPRCGHMQLDASNCARCGVDLEVAMRDRQKEDQLIEKKIREMRSGPEAPTGAVRNKSRKFGQASISTADERRAAGGQKRRILGWRRG